MSDPSPVPFWLADPDLPAPCPCGQPIMGPYVIVEGRTGLKWICHPVDECIRLTFEGDEDDEDEDRSE